jgi:CRP-like cAMP-binding protein
LTRKEDDPAGSGIAALNSTLSHVIERATGFGRPDENADRLAEMNEVRKTFFQEDALDTAPKRFVLDPLSTPRMAFDCVGLILVGWISGQIPYEAAFQPDNKVSYGFDFQMFVDIFFVIDLVLNFRTGFVEKGKIILDTEKIASKYLRTYFIFDFVASIPYDLVIFLMESYSDYSPRALRSLRMFRVVRLLRAVRMRQMISKLDDLVNSNFISVCLHLSSYLIIIVYASHWAACLWWWIGSAGRTRYEWSWSSIVEPTDDAYLASLYAAMMTLSGVGFGDVVAANPVERVISMLFMIGNCLLFAMVVGSSMKVLAQHSADNVEFERNLSQTSKFLKNQSVDSELVLRVRKYLEETYNNRPLTNLPPWAAKELSTNLLSEVLTALQLPLLRQMPLFAECSRLFLVRLCVSLTTRRFIPGEAVYSAGTLLQSMFFVACGRLVQVHSGSHDHRTIAVGTSQVIEKDDRKMKDHRDTITKSITKQNTITVNKEQVIEYWPGSWFGEVALFASQTYQFTVFVAAFAETLEVSSKVLKTTLKEFPTFLSEYLEMSANVKNGRADLLDDMIDCPITGQEGNVFWKGERDPRAVY